MRYSCKLFSEENGAISRKLDRKYLNASCNVVHHTLMLCPVDHFDPKVDQLGTTQPLKSIASDLYLETCEVCRPFRMEQSLQSNRKRLRNAEEKLNALR